MLLFQLIVAALIAIVQSERVKRMEGGTHTEISNVPYQAVFISYDQEKNSTEVICGGTIVSQFEVLTSASCAKQFNSSTTFVNVGSSNVKDKNVNNFGILKIIPHENFTSEHELSPYNVALVKVTKPIVCNNCKPIEIADQSEMLLNPNDTVLISGFGESVKFEAEWLRSINLTIGDEEKCNLMYEVYGKLTRSQRCAVAWNDKDNLVGPCGGDFGGPVVNENKKLVGILTHGDIFCHSTLPAVIEVIDHKLQAWIEKNKTLLLAQNLSPAA